MKKRTSFWIQAIGVLTLVLGNFFTAGTALADVISAKEVIADNAKLIDDKRALVTRSKVGDHANLAFDVTVGGLSQAGTVQFDYNADYFKVKKKQFKFSNGDTKVVVDIDGDESTISWTNAIDKTDLEVILPVKFNQTVNNGELDVMIDDERLKLPTLTVVDKDEKVKEAATAEQPDGNLQDDDILKEALADESASDEADAAREAEEAQKQTEVKNEEQTQSESKKNEEIDENSSQADAVEKGKQSNTEKAEALLKEKREADQKRAEEKSRQAIEDRKNAEQQVKSKDATTKSVKDTGETKESTTPETPEVSDLKGAKEAIADTDDADGEEPVADDLKREMPVNGVFEEEPGRDITEMIKNSENPQFFKSIHYKYTDKDGKVQTKEVDAVLDHPIELPDVLRDHKNIEILYEWDIDTIKEATGIDIQHKDHYDFKLKGMKYNYGNAGKFDELINYGGKTIGQFIMTPTADPDVQQVSIIFLPDELAGVTNIEYKAQLKTEINVDADEISFGETIIKDGGIEVEKKLVSIKKEGNFHTENGVTDLDTLQWTSTFNVNDDLKAEEVILKEKFHSGYQTEKAKVEYTFEITTADDKTVTITRADTGAYNDILSPAGNDIFKFNQNDLKLSDGIVQIKMTMVTAATILGQNTYKNEIQAQEVTLTGVDEKAKTALTDATITRKANELKKSAEMDENGNIKYSVKFSVESGQSNIILKDTLDTDKFEFSTEAGDYKLNPHLDGWMIGSPVVDGQTLTVKFDDKIVPGTGKQEYTFTYIVKPAGDVTDNDYIGIRNTVEVNGEKKGHQYTPAFNSKYNTKLDWDAMTSNWKIHVNQTNRDVNSAFTITEPTPNSEQVNYLDFSSFYQSFTDENGLTTEVNKKIKFSEKEGNIWDYEVRDGEAYWKNGSQTEAAFTVTKSEENEDQIIIKVNNLPYTDSVKKTSFTIFLNNVPLDKEKVLNAEQGKMSQICNYSTVDYPGIGKNDVKACKSVAWNVRNNISKTGQFSSDFLKDGIINWTTRFNYRSYLGTDEEKALVTDGIDITDQVGEDVIKDAGNKVTSRHLQEIKDRLIDSLQVSLAKINTDGNGIQEPTTLDKDDYSIKVDVNDNQKVTFNLKLSPKAYALYKAGQKVIGLQYQSKVTDFKADVDTNYEHLKSWTFNNKVNVNWNKNDKGEYVHSLEANASLSYTDNGYLLHKNGEILEDPIELNEGDHNRIISAVKWDLTINGNGATLKAPVQLTDSLSGGHYHLKTNDSDYQLKITEAKRSFDKGNAVYEKVANGVLKEGQDYEVVYSDTLNTMTIKIKSPYQVTTPLIVEYYTVISKTVGTSYANELKLSISTSDFDQKEEIKSSASVSGQYKKFAANIKKIDAATGDPLPGVKFKVQMKNQNNDWNDVGNPKLTDKDGFASFDGLFDKPTYRIIEVSGLENYDDRWVSKEFTIADAQEETEDGNENTYCVTAENHRTNALKIKKTVTNGLGVNKDDSFEFKVYVTDKDGNVDADFNDEFSYDVDGQSDIVTFKDGVSTNLQKIKDGQTITIKGLPQDKYYRVVESANGSYRTSYTLENLTTVDTDGNETNETDTFQMQQGKDAATGIVKFTNEGKTTHFGFSKLIEGPNAKADKDKEFSFMMKIMNESGALDTDFSGEIEGIKHTGSGDANVTFDFENGEAKEVIYSDGSISDIKLKTGESYRNIKLPANVKVKVYEKQDGQYTEVHYKVGDGDENEAGDSDEDGWKATGSISADNSTIKFINREVVNQFEFEKLVAGDMPEGLQDFEFEVEANDDATRDAVKGQIYTADIRNATTDKTKNTGKVRFDENGKAIEITYGSLPKDTIKLQDNEKLVILGLPNKASKFKVTETTTGKFNTYTRVDGESKKDGKSAEIALNRPDSKNSIMFENIAPDLVEFDIKKTVSGVIPPVDEDLEFDFELTIQDPPVSWTDQEVLVDAIKSDANEIEPLKFNKNTSSGQYKATVSLKAEQSIRIFIPKGLNIKVTETSTNGYKVSHEFGNHREDGDTHDVTTGKDMPQLVFNNDSQKTGIEVKKTVKGETAGQEDFSKVFEFKVTGTDDDGKHLNGEYTLRKFEVSGKYSDEDVIFKDNLITFELQHDQKAQILGLPIGAKIQVKETEKSSEGYDPSYIVNDNSEKQGHVATEFVTTEDGLGKVQFINTLPTPESTNLRVKKVLAGPVTDDDKAYEFEFRVTATPKDGVKDELNGEFDAEILDHNGDTKDVKVKFVNGRSEMPNPNPKDENEPIKLKGGKSINILKLPTDYKYSVNERTHFQRFMYEVSYNVNDTTDKIGDDTGQFTLKDGQQGEVVFTNTKFEVEKAELEISKKLAGGGIIDADKNKTFQFVIETDPSVDGEYEAVVNRHDKVKVQFTDGKATVNLRADDYLVIKGLPSAHNTYTVSEMNGSGFTTQYQLNGTRTEDGVKTKEFKLIEGDRSTVQFTNSKETEKVASLKINKEIAGDGLTTSDHDRDFNFRIYSGVTGEFDAIKVDQGGDSHEMKVKFANGQSDVITLKDGESLTVNDLPIEYRYAVGEEYVDGFAPTYKVNDAKVQEGMTTQTFKLLDNQKGTVEFTNTKNGEIELGILSVSKFVNELGDRTRKFDFHIEVTDGSNNPLNGTFKTQVTTNGQAADGTIQLNGGNGQFTLTHGQSIKFFLPLGAKYEVAEQDYTKDGYVTTVTKRSVVVNDPTVIGTATKEDDSIVYHNDLEDDEAILPLPGEEDDSSASLDSDKPSSTTGKSSIDSPMGIPSSGYTGKSALPQTGEDHNTLLMVIGMFMLVCLLGIGTTYYAKRKQEK